MSYNCRGVFFFAVICFSVFLIDGQSRVNAAECVRTGIGDATCRSLAPPTSIRPPTGRPSGVTPAVRPVARPTTLPGTSAPLTSVRPQVRPSSVGPTVNPHPPSAAPKLAVPKIDTDNESAKNIAEAAYETLGFSTVADDTEGGNKGCAVAVSEILDKAGYGVGRITGTATLFDTLNDDDCFELVYSAMDYTRGAEKLRHDRLQPGDVLVTKARGSRAGHTGVYVGNGNIISNASAGYNGSDPGTVEQNYTVDKWNRGDGTNRGVIPRNGQGSGVFRRKEGC